MTPDPYHTPGYGGYCPQFKYAIGETFGRTTSNLLNNNDVASSGRLVLAKLAPETLEESDRKKQDKLSIIRTRTQSWGDQKLAEKMVPGYTGYIPKSEHYFGQSYGERCNQAITTFENAQRQDKKKITDLRMTEALQSGRMKMDSTNPTLPKIATAHLTPLQPIAKEPKPYMSKNLPQHTMSPFFMNNDNAQKRFMSGYTGFVPRSRNMLGFGYPLITHNALNEFTDEQHRIVKVRNQPIQVHRQNAKVDTITVYPAESGLVPHYTGHIPGEKFRYGQTFGHSTKNALSGQSTKNAVRSTVPTTA